jgi:hypothetical protein
LFREQPEANANMTRKRRQVEILESLIMYPFGCHTPKSKDAVGQVDVVWEVKLDARAGTLGCDLGPGGAFYRVPIAERAADSEPEYLLWRLI